MKYILYNEDFETQGSFSSIQELRNFLCDRKYDIQCMSIGFLTEEQTPMIWRGPMVTSAIKTFTQKV